MSKFFKWSVVVAVMVTAVYALYAIFTKSTTEEV